MQIRFQPDGLKSPRIIEDAQSVVIYDEHGNAMYIAQQIDKNTCVCEKAGQPGFEKLLKELGIGLSTKYVVVRS